MAAYRARWGEDDLLEIHWPTASDLARSLRGSFDLGIVRATPGRPATSTVALQLHLPDGQVLRLTGRLVDQGGDTEVRFSVTRALRHKLQRATRG